MSYPPRFIDEIMPALCKAAACAIRWYAKMSNEFPHVDMPESYVVGSVFRRIGTNFRPGVSLTMETNLRKMSGWNEDAKRARLANTAMNRGEARESWSKELTDRFGENPRVDLVLFHGDNPDPSTHGFMAAIEFKRDLYSAEDREKLIAILGTIDECPAGAIVGMLQLGTQSDVLHRERSVSKEVGDVWFEHPVNYVLAGAPEYVVVARAFERPFG